MTHQLIIFFSGIIFSCSVAFFLRKRIKSTINSYQSKSESKIGLIEKELLDISRYLEERESFLQSKQIEFDIAKKNAHIVLDELKIKSEKEFDQKIELEFDEIKKDIEIIKNRKILEVSQKINSNLTDLIIDKPNVISNLDIKEISKYLPNGEAVRH